MPSENIKEANAFIAALREKREAYSKFTKEKIPGLFRKDHQKDRRPPRDFVDSSYLYIRSYDSDNGSRPLTQNPFWLSPDITVAPLNDLNAYTRLLDAGKTYQFTCHVRNRGDLIVPSAKVEFFLCEPTLGFDTRFATKLGVTSGWVNPYATTKVHIQYAVPPAFSGHKCLFARTFSFSPVDLPIDDYKLSSWYDRHVGQLNLDFVAQQTTFMFNLVHLPNAIDEIALIPLKTEEIIATRHPFLADFRINTAGTDRILAKVKIELKRNDKRLQRSVQRKDNGLNFESSKVHGVSFKEQAAIHERMMHLLGRKAEQPVNDKESRRIIRAYRDMNNQMEQTTFELHLPDFGLKDNEATAFHIVSRNTITGEVKGGITVVVTV